MIESVDGCLAIRSAMLTDNARQLLAEGCAKMSGTAVRIDLSAVTEADSAAIAVMLGWLRHASAQGLQLSFSGIPSGVRSLAELYGVVDLLPQA